MRLRIPLVVLIAGAAAVAACDRSATGPDRTASRSSSAGGTDTSGTPPTGQPNQPPSGPAGPDTGTTGYQGSVQLTVRVAGYVRTNAPNGADTLQLQNVSGAAVSIEAITAAGIGPAQSLGNTNAQGVVTATVPSGAYRLRAVPPAGSGYNAAEASILADRQVIVAQVNVWKP